MTRMRLSFEELQYVVGSEDNASDMMDARMMHPFEGIVIDFLNDLSELLRGNRQYSDVATFGFWCRRAAILKERDKYDDINERYGKGIVFHSTPSNVPVNFAFSFAAGLLAGNANIVRLPGKAFDQVSIICDSVNELLSQKYKALASYVVFVKFPPIKDITDAFSQICNVRVIWGGDMTISELRQSPIPARSTEITFADRHSLAIINSDEYINEANKDMVIQSFYNDTFYSDQNACTSPRIIFWYGNSIEEAKKDFWNRVHELVKLKYTLSPAQAVGKLDALYTLASQKDIQVEKCSDNYVTRIVVDKIDRDLMKYKYNSGFFFEKDISDFEEIANACDLKCQTITYYGFSKEEFASFLDKIRPLGVDRIVPIGKSMDFSLVWDGYDLIRQMSRKIIISGR